ncbi:MAG TPA: DUF4115 domain-containing protein [Acidimicrobiales bacterium]|nr:DUF4115 domain-containing protein [Acidimicrobiales bacterium]
MTLLVVLLAALAAGTAAQGARGRFRRLPSGSHQRALGALDAMTRRPGQPGPAQPGALDGMTGARQHVRLVAATSAAPSRPVPRPVTSGVRRSGAAPFRAPRPMPEEVLVPAAPLAPALPASELAAGDDDGRRLVRFDESGLDTPGASRAEPPAGHPTAGRDPGGRRPAARRAPRTRRPAARTSLLVGAAAALAVTGGAAALIAGGGTGRPATPAAPPDAAPARPAATVPAPSPTTTAPPPVSLASSSPAGSVYTVTGPVTIAITAADASWVQVRSGGPSGAVISEGLLAAGRTETVPAPVWIRLGNPTGVTVVVNGTPVRAPSLVSGRPTNLQFG